MTRCIKVAKNSIQQRRAGLAERSRAGAGEAVVLGSFFGGLLCRYSKR